MHKREIMPILNFVEQIRKYPDDFEFETIEYYDIQEDEEFKQYAFNNPKRFAQLSAIKSSSCPISYKTIHIDRDGVQFKPIFIHTVADNIDVVVWEEIKANN